MLQIIRDNGRLNVTYYKFEIDESKGELLSLWQLGYIMKVIACNLLLYFKVNLMPIVLSHFDLLRT